MTQNSNPVPSYTVGQSLKAMLDPNMRSISASWTLMIKNIDIESENNLIALLNDIEEVFLSCSTWVCAAAMNTLINSGLRRMALIWHAQRKSQSSPLGKSDRNSRQDLADWDGSWNHIGFLFTGLLLMTCSDCLLIQLRNTCPEVALFPVDWPLPHPVLIKKFSHRLAYKSTW